jgi:cold shock protein
LQQRSFPKVTDTARHIGVVKWFTASRGYGFIQPSDGSHDVFVHASAVDRSGIRLIDEGDRLEYSLMIDPKNGKPCAADLKLI